jgi:hypothetical protein
VSDGSGSIDFGREEAISPFGNGFNVSGIFGVVAQSLPQLTNCHSQAILKINECILLPQPVPKLLAADYFARIFQ